MAAIDDLMKALESNNELIEKINSATTPADAVQIALDAGFKVTANELLEAYKSKVSALTDDELSAVSGGKGRTTGGRGSTGGSPVYSSDRGNTL